MVGAAQYRDEEIDWVLTAVVNKKKQSYIQERFKHKFGRELNHNQIRYIKNKYGKDPKFNSPLINIRQDRRRLSSSSSSVVELEEEEALYSKPGESSSSAAQTVDVHKERKHSSAVSIKRKRMENEKENVGRAASHTAKVQRLNPPPNMVGLTQPGEASMSTPERDPWNIAAARHTLAHIQASPSAGAPIAYESGRSNTLQTPPQPSTNWMRSMSGASEAPYITVSSGTSAPRQTTVPSTASMVNHPNTILGPYAFPSSAQLSHLPQTMSPQHMRQHSLSYTPSMPQMTYSTSRQPTAHDEPRADFVQGDRLEQHNLQPGFQEHEALHGLTIEDAVWDNDAQASTLDSTRVPGWTDILAPSPFERSPLEPLPPPMPFPFDNVRHTGLTASSAREIGILCQERKISLPRVAMSSASRRSSQVFRDSNRVATTSTPEGSVLTTTSATGLSRSHNLQLPAGSVSELHPSSGLGQQRLGVESNPFVGTIDPRLLGESRKSPPPDHNMKLESSPQ